MSENQLPEDSPIPQSNDPMLPVPMPSTPAETVPADAPPPAPVTTGRRPTGITILAILAAVSGFVGLCCSSPLLVGLSAIGIVIPTGITQVLGVFGLLLACVLAFGPVLQIAFAYGAWNLRSWAWLLGIVAMGLSVLGVLVNVVGSGGAMAWTAITNGIIPIVIFVYLLLPGVRKSFNL